MDVLLIVLVSLVLLDCFLIVLTILLQEDKSGGGIGIIGGSSQSFFGASSGSILAKITTILFVVFMVLVVTIALLSASFTRDSTITTKDISQIESLEYGANPVKKLLTEAPQKIQASDFEGVIIVKITDEKNKSLLTSSYTKDSSSKLYALKDKVSKEDNKKITDILNSIGFSLEAETTVVNSTTSDTLKDVTADATNDKNK